MQDKIAIIIQARAGSNRLPNKVLLPFYNDLSILDIIIQRLKESKYNKDIILATSDNLKDNKIAEFAIKHNILLFRGDENNVLDRFVKCAEEYKMEKIIRVCADNPFILIKYIDDLIDIAIEDKVFDYISYKNSENTPVIKTHLGLFAEFVNLVSLKKVLEKTSDVLYREHVTNYIYSNPDIFKINLVPLPESLIDRKDLRFTCDTIDDFNMLKKLYAAYIATLNTNKIDLENLLSLVNNNQEYLNVMIKGIKQFEK